jgi:hypothetical protein
VALSGARWGISQYPHRTVGSLRFCNNGGLAVIAASALASAACLVDNPAFDLREGDGQFSVNDAAAVEVAAFGGADAGVVLADVVNEREGGAIVDGGPLVPACDVHDGHLQFLLDQSPNKVVVTGDPHFTTGPDGLAYTVKNAVGLQTPALPAFVSPRLTLDMWVKLAAWPETQTQALVAVPDVIGLFITGKGELVCDVGNIRATAPLREVPLAKWQGVACVYDGISIGIYINGLIAGSRAFDRFTPAVTKASLFVGSATDFDAFTGSLDNVRLWSRRMPPAELCTSSPDQSECSQLNL